MGFFDVMRKILPKVSAAREYHHAPSDRFPTQADLMAYLMELIEPEGWASFEAPEHGQTVLIQVTRDSINTCQAHVDVTAIAQRLGLEALAATIVRGNDHTIHQLPKASPREIAEVVHGIFIHHFDLTPAYRVEGWLEG